MVMPYNCVFVTSYYIYAYKVLSETCIGIHHRYMPLYILYNLMESYSVEVAGRTVNPLS